MTSKSNRRVKEIVALCLLALALLLVFSLATYHSSDSTLLSTSSGKTTVRNMMGIVGANLAAILLVAIGVSAYWLPFFLMVTLILMRPYLIASLIGRPHDQRYWTYLIGLALFGLLYLVQRPRIPKAEATPAAMAFTTSIP